MKIIVTRSEPGGSAFASQLRGLGFDAVCIPLLEAVPTNNPAPVMNPDALIVTSAHAIPYAEIFEDRPLYAVGPGTAEAARTYGWKDVIEGPGDVRSLSGILPRGKALLHVAGEDLSPDTEAVLAPFNTARWSVYRTVPTGFEGRIFEGDEPKLVTLHSARSSAILGAYVRAYQERMDARLIIYLCLSSGVLESLGNHPAGTPGLYVADVPTQEALIQSIRQLI